MRRTHRIATLRLSPQLPPTFLRMVRRLACAPAASRLCFLLGGAAGALLSRQLSRRLVRNSRARRGDASHRARRPPPPLPPALLVSAADRRPAEAQAGGGEAVPQEEAACAGGCAAERRGGRREPRPPPLPSTCARGASPAHHAPAPRLPLLQSPNSFFMDVRCSGCMTITTVFSHATNVSIVFLLPLPPAKQRTALSQPFAPAARRLDGSPHPPTVSPPPPPPPLAAAGRHLRVLRRRPLPADGRQGAPDGGLQLPQEAGLSCCCC